MRRRPLESVGDAPRLHASTESRCHDAGPPRRRGSPRRADRDRAACSLRTRTCADEPHRMIRGKAARGARRAQQAKLVTQGGKQDWIDGNGRVVCAPKISRAASHGKSPRHSRAPTLPCGAHNSAGVEHTTRMSRVSRVNFPRSGSFERWTVVDRLGTGPRRNRLRWRRASSRPSRSRSSAWRPDSWSRCGQCYGCASSVGMPYTVSRRRAARCGRRAASACSPLQREQESKRVTV